MGSSDRFTPYQRRLFIFLSVASFFEGYDFMALSQVLPTLREDMELSKAMAGNMYAIISFGTMVAYLLVRKADHWGRKRVLTITIAGYTLFTFFSGLAPDPYSFTVAQFLARIFLIAEWGVSMVYAAEEFPAAKRAHVIGIIQAFTAMGSIVCAGVAPMLVETPWGWRTVYLIAVVPLVLIMYARRGLRETRRFEQDVQGTTSPRPPWHILTTPHRKRVLEMSLIWGVSYLCGNVALFFWKDFAVNEAGLTKAQAGGSIALASVVAMPLVLITGRLLDRWGRRPGGALVLGATGIGVALSYQQLGRWELTAALILGVYGAAAMPIVLNTLTTELFPTNMRADAFAVCNNLLGRIGYVAGPALVGVAADAVGEFGPVVAASGAFPLIAVGLIFAFVPETKGRELEDTAAVDPG